VIVIGAGAGGLAAAIDLARADVAVTVLERAAAPGGKMRQVRVDGAAVDAGPTVFTMRWVFEQLFDDADASLEAAVRPRKADVLARHAWTTGGQLDLHADVDRSAAAIEAFAGRAEADGFLRFIARAADVHATLRDTFMAAQRPTPLGLVNRVGWTNLDALWRTAPFRTLWNELGRYFRDPRLLQLFARYATYCGSSPLAAPATLMVVAHVEQEGVWLLDGGMHGLAQAMCTLGQQQGAEYRFGVDVARIERMRGVTAVYTRAGERLVADAVVFNGDVAALASGALGPDVRRAVPRTHAAQRSLSAVVWCAHAKTRGFGLGYHNVFFAPDYEDEFRAIFERRAIAAEPTVYVCAQDRGGTEPLPAGAPERLQLLINAPALSESGSGDTSDRAAPQERMRRVLQRCGLELDLNPEAMQCTDPSGFAALFPATGGAIYGRATHGPFASLARPAARSRVAGLYLAGGSAHPGPGVPMATLSGRLAARQLLADMRR
jgi:1-hydroxycarotenoid 3,4-desaturase